jgi:hypothetical protein
MSSPDEATGLALAFGQLVGNKYQVALVFAIINIRSTMGLGLIALPEHGRDGRNSNWLEE